ncbi:hypothetical protein DXG01_008312 [Tephrocybe rancida]|nr:hypothetical protein DXG01_008312 [Tephrocybe rancida]
MKILSTVLVLSVLSTVHACGDGQDHSHGRRSVAPSSVTPPTRPLVWGDINILHTTDTHGWLLGHQEPSFPEPNYSGDFGDFASFVSRMKYIAAVRFTSFNMYSKALKAKGVDLLLVDSGDLHDGSGLTEGYPAGGVDGRDVSGSICASESRANPFSGERDICEIAVRPPDDRQNFIPKFEGKYLSSNAYIELPDEKTASIGAQTRTFTTLQGRTVISFGVLFDFAGFDKKGAGKLSVTKVADMVEQQWFKDAIKEKADLFLIPGRVTRHASALHTSDSYRSHRHMPVTTGDRYNAWSVVHNKIRTVEVGSKKIHEHTPIIYLGGHTHIRDCGMRNKIVLVVCSQKLIPVKLDTESMSLQSGRYMETIGANLTAGKVAFSRRYLDANTVTYEYHTSLKGHDFQTTLGNYVSDLLAALSDKFGLSTVFGVAPRDYTTNQKSFTEEGNLLKLWIEEALPYALSTDKKGTNANNLIIANNNSQRFDVYSGPFTKNDQLSASFYTDKFLFLPNIKLSDAKAVLTALNAPPKTGVHGRSLNADQEATDDVGYADERYRGWLQDMHRRNGLAKRNSANTWKTPGYVTKDSCGTDGTDGDDTPHNALAYHEVPHYISSKPPTVSDDTPIDLVFLNYIWDQSNPQRPDYIRQILNKKAGTDKYKKEDAKAYSDIVSNEAIAVYAKAKWN